ncbi:MAG: beta-N-acetylhexosaminidase, partial [Phycisphaerae bacterium]|nr:beta-N-acetylhexosaminidase [Phycisphaerae bacterium]
RQASREQEEASAAVKYGNVAIGEVPDYVEPAGVNCVEVYARNGDGERILAGRVGQRRQKEPLSESALSINVGLEATELIVRMDSFNRDILLTGLEVWGAALDEPKVYPVPQKMTLDGKDAFKLTDAPKIVVGKDACEDTLFSATLLAEKIKENLGLTASVVTDDQVGGAIALGKPGECEPLDKAGLTEAKADGYTLNVRTDGAFLVAGDRRGLIYGVETLLQLLGSEEPSAPTCLIEDYPKMEFRGVHFFMPHRKDIPFIKRMIRYVWAPMKMNTIFLQVTSGMKFDRRPEINETWERENKKAAEGKAPPVPHCELGGGTYLTKDEVRDLVNYAKSYGFEVIPEVQSLSHVEYLTMTYPEIAEKPGVYPDAYCPLHPDSHKIVFDMIDEIIEVFQPERYIEMGHDEVYTLGVCDRCKNKSRAELYALDVNTIYDYLKSKGLGMMIWSDMIHDFRPYGTPEAIDMIPKDIVMMDFIWYFRTSEDIETRLLDHGFKVIMGNFYSSHYPRFTRRSAREGVVGAEVSTWRHADEDVFGKTGKIYDFIYSANMIWSEHYSDEMRWTMDRKIAEIMPKIRSQISDTRLPAPPSKAKSFSPINLTGLTTAPKRDQTGGKGGYDLTGLASGEVTLKGIPFGISDGVVFVEAGGGLCPAQVEVPVGARADSLVFLHTASADAPKRTPLGRYEIVYTDDSTTEVQIKHGWQLAEWNRRFAAPLAHIRHRHGGYVGTYPSDAMWQGKTPAGQDVTLYGFEWANPHPDKEIETLRIKADESATDAALITVAVTGITYERK